MVGKPEVSQYGVLGDRRSDPSLYIFRPKPLLLWQVRAGSQADFTSSQLADCMQIIGVQLNRLGSIWGPKRPIFGLNSGRLAV